MTRHIRRARPLSATRQAWLVREMDRLSPFSRNIVCSAIRGLVKTESQLGHRDLGRLVADSRRQKGMAS